MNMIIAQMGDSFEEAQGKREIIIYQSRVQLISEFVFVAEKKLEFTQHEQPEYLYLVERIQADGIASKGWEGKLVSMQRAFQREIKGVKSSMATYQKETRSLIKDSEERSDESKLKINEVCTSTNDIAIQITIASAKINENSAKVNENTAQINKITSHIEEIREKVKDGVGSSKPEADSDLPRKVGNQISEEMLPQFKEMKQSFDDKLANVENGFKSQLSDQMNTIKALLETVAKQQQQMQEQQQLMKDQQQQMQEQQQQLMQKQEEQK